MNNSLSIRISGNHGSISDLTWSDIPSFVVLTGVNGAGKSQLLQIIANSLGAFHQNPRVRPVVEIKSTAQIEGDSFSVGEVFYSDGEWPTLYSGAATEDQIKEEIRRLHNDKSNEWLWSQLAKKLEIGLEEVKNLSLIEFYDHLTPGFLWGCNFPRGTNSLSFLFLAYRLFERDSFANGLSAKEIQEKYNEPPWDLMNEILDASGLAFQVNCPEIHNPTSLVNPQSFNLVLLDKLRNAEVPFSSLSSGEKIIMATALWRYGAELTGRHYKLLLLDEPDAHLHPSLTRKFLNVIQRVFVEERGVRVIMSTHSPSTVALVPCESIYEMQRNDPRIERTMSRDNAIAKLTGGFISVQEATQTVFVEGKDDPAFYNLVWDLLTERSGLASYGPLNPYPNIQFIHGQGKNTVNLIVPQIREKGLTMFHGIIDRDKGNTALDGIYVLERNALENYLYDPLNVWVLLRLENAHFDISDINVPIGRCAFLKNLPITKLQLIVNEVILRVQNLFPKNDPASLELETIEYVGGITLKYPKWFLFHDDKAIQEEFRKTFGYQYLTHAKLIRSYATLNLIPQDIFNILKNIQSKNLTQ